MIYMDQNNKKDWKTILKEKGFDSDFREYVDDYVKKQIIKNEDKDKDTFFYSMIESLRPYTVGYQDSIRSKNEYYGNKDIRNNFLKIMLSSKGYSSGEIDYVIHYCDPFKNDYRLLKPDYYRFLDAQIKVNKDPINKLNQFGYDVIPTIVNEITSKNNIRNNLNWPNILIQLGLSLEQIETIKTKINLNITPVNFENFEKIEKLLNLNKKNEYSILNYEGSLDVSPEKIMYRIDSSSLDDLKIASMYIKAGYLSSEYEEFNPRLFHYLEKRRKALLNNGYSAEDVLFITMTGFLESDDEVIANELKNSAKFREENSNEFNSIISNDYPFNGIEEYANKYYNHKLDEFISHMNDKGYTAKQIANIIDDYKYEGKLDGYNFVSHMEQVYEKRGKVYSLDYRFNDLNNYILDELFPLYKKYGTLPSAQISLLEKLYEGMTASMDLQLENERKAKAKHQLRIDNMDELRSNIKKAIKVAPGVLGAGTMITAAGVGVIKCLEISNFKDTALTFIENNPGFVVAGGYVVVLGSLLGLLTSMPAIMHYDFGGPRQK